MLMHKWIEGVTQHFWIVIRELLNAKANNMPRMFSAHLYQKLDFQLKQ